MHQGCLIYFVKLIAKALPPSLISAISKSLFWKKASTRSARVLWTEGLVEIEVVNGPVQGAHLKLNLKAEKYYWLGAYELELMRAIEKFTKVGMVVYDVGANIGYVSLVFAGSVGPTGRVYAFEPLPSNISRLREHVILNSVEDLVIIEPFAVTTQVGQETFLIHSLHNMGKLITSDGRHENYKQSIVVDTIHLDDFVFKGGHRAPSIVKIDVEGGGKGVLLGMRRILSECRPLIFAELHGSEEGVSALQILRQANYSIIRMHKNYQEAVKEADIGECAVYVVGLPLEIIF